MTYDQTHWAPARRRGQLPTFYYHEHFLEMLGFVERHYPHVLLEDHVAFIRNFRELPRPAQCLYVRLVNRKGRVFARNRLRYPELGDVANLVGLLEESGWVGTPGVGHFDELLRFLTRDEIYRVLLPQFTGLARSMKKSQLVDFARENVAAQNFVDILDTERILVQRRHDDVRFLLFLYFGRIRSTLSQFTMRDLGLVRTRKFGDNYEPRFSDRAEALENYFFASRLEVVREAQGVAVPCEPLAEWPAANFSSSASLRDELALVHGRKLEETGDRDAALQLYKAGESAQCSERAMRLLLAVGPREEARRYIERCIDDPRSDEEWLVAKDLYARKFHKKRTSDMTDMLRAAEIVDIDESRSGRPERAVAEHFERLGCTAYRSENLLWRTLFGLLFWDELFAGDTASVASPFEFLPPMLANGTFYGRYRKAIEKKLASLADRGVTKRSILMASTRHYGTPNGVFRWRESMNDAVIALLDAGDGKAIAQVLGAMAKNYSDRRYGYPDLMVVGADGLRFIEVKTPGDQLRRNQVLRIRELREAGMRADVVRVRWILDPAQTYVVVDVETTGGKGEGHRVTEIGAVKVRDGKVVDRFQTLLNPQRTIPANISRLTGITPAMVQDAPYFADIADDLEAFLEDSIFVAHNVEFDYGFMAREFARIGRPFHYPKLCTCASMRRLFPGHRSYSLASLCRRYDISLNQHHRALCDAEAAAELLLLINEKRMSAND